jgi:hypothetical protein
VRCSATGRDWPSRHWHGGGTHWPRRSHRQLPVSPSPCCGSGCRRGSAPTRGSQLQPECQQPLALASGLRPGLPGCQAVHCHDGQGQQAGAQPVLYRQSNKGYRRAAPSTAMTTSAWLNPGKLNRPEQPVRPTDLFYCAMRKFESKVQNGCRLRAVSCTFLLVDSRTPF